MELSLPEDGKRTIEWQEAMLAALVEPAFVKNAPGVKGPFTSGEYVTWLLNLIFGPANWSHRIVGEPTLNTINEAQGYSQVIVSLSVQFVNGKQVTHEDIGIWPFSATKGKQGGTLESTAAERYEQVLKSAVTDGLKACTDHLGTCFRPMADQELLGLLSRKAAQESLHEKLGEQKESAEKSASDLFGEQPGKEDKSLAKAIKEKLGVKAEVVSQEMQVEEAATEIVVPGIKTISDFWAWALKDRELDRSEVWEVLKAHLGEIEPKEYLEEVGLEAGLQDFAARVIEALL